MIEVFKITHNIYIYDSHASLKLPYHHHSSITRGNKYKILNHRFHYDLQKTLFFLHVLSTYGIVVDVTTVSVTCSNHALIGSG